MYKSIFKKIVIAFIILFIFIEIVNYVHATNNEITNNWEVAITSDAKEIKDTHEIKFKVEENPYVIPGKIAPGIKASSEIEIDLRKISGFVDVEVNIDKSKLNEVFKITAKLNGKTLPFEQKTRIAAGNKEKIVLNLNWDSDNKIDTLIANNVETIEIPVEVKIMQNI